MHHQSSDRGGVCRGRVAGGPVSDRRAGRDPRAVSAASRARTRELVSRARWQSRHGRSAAGSVSSGVPVAARMARGGKPVDLDRSRGGTRGVSLPVAEGAPRADRHDERRGSGGDRAVGRRTGSAASARPRWRGSVVCGAREVVAGIAARIHAARDRWSHDRRDGQADRLVGDCDEGPRVACTQVGRAGRRQRYGAQRIHRTHVDSEQRLRRGCVR